MKSCYCYKIPLGEIWIADDGESITDVSYSALPADMREEQTALGRRAEAQLKEYFEGERKQFDLPLAPHGTPFQRQVWEALLQIPYAQTRSYGQIASVVGNPKGARAVGMANNRNPIAIIIPCHRVLGADGKLIGYAGGLDKKELLLELER